MTVDPSTAPSAEDLIRPLVNESESLTVATLGHLGQVANIRVTVLEAFSRNSIRQQEREFSTLLQSVSAYEQKANKLAAALALSLLAPHQSLNVQLVLGLYRWQLGHLLANLQARVQAIEASLSNKRMEANNKATLTIGLLTLSVVLIALAVSFTSIFVGS